MSIKGFSVDGVVQRYDYTALDNLPQGQGVSEDLKAALLQLAKKVAYIDDQGQTYYDDLYNALYPEKTLLSIMANFQQGQAVIYNTDSLDTLKQYLTVTAVYDDTSTATVASSAYTLSGSLTVGTSVITVTYEGKTDAFNVSVTAAPMSFAVTNNLTGCTTSNSATAVLEGNSYTAVITASSGYTLVGATVSITMGGQDITTSAYSGGIISINNVTGVLVIAVSAVERVLSSITAVYTQSGTVYETDTLDSLKADLVVTAVYSDSSTQTVPAADYTLSGTLTVGTSTITVSYGGKTATFSVTVTHANLPSEYQEVEYVQRPSGSGVGVFANTGVSLDGTGNVVIEAEFMSTAAASYDQYIVGVRENVSSKSATTVLAVGTNASENGIFAYSGDRAEILLESGTTVNKRYNVTATFTDSGCSINDGTTTESTSYDPLGYTGQPIHIFGRRKYNVSQISDGFVGNCYYVKVTENNVTKLELIPCTRNSDDAVGFYNKTTGTFITNANFVAGPAVQ